MLSVVVLSAAGIYALMSFTVSRAPARDRHSRRARRRSAIAFSPGSFRARSAQLAIGAAVGMLGAVGLEQVLEGEMFQGQGAIILPS